MINYKEIFNAWKISFKPTTLQAEVAEKRLDICKGCEFKKEMVYNKQWSAICDKCKCPLAKKVFSAEKNPCPVNKWDVLNNQYESVFTTQKRDLI